jgi:hypothetical protein
VGATGLLVGASELLVGATASNGAAIIESPSSCMHYHVGAIRLVIIVIQLLVGHGVVVTAGDC